MNTRTGWFVVAVLLVVIVVLVIALFFAPVPQHPSASAPTATSTAVTTADASSSQTFSGQVSVSSPQPNAAVGQTFTVSGIAPNTWYFEAVFPIQVRDANDDLVGQGQGNAQSDWTTPGPVPFTATVTIQNNYQGLASLILLKDNPSELPQNADEVTIPIVVQ